VVVKAANVAYTSPGIDTRYKQLYLGKYVKLDPNVTGHFFAKSR